MNHWEFNFNSTEKLIIGNVEWTLGNIRNRGNDSLNNQPLSAPASTTIYLIFDHIDNYYGQIVPVLDMKFVNLELRDK